VYLLATGRRSSLAENGTTFENGCAWIILATLFLNGEKARPSKQKLRDALKV
jgi:hypothetical protein